MCFQASSVCSCNCDQSESAMDTCFYTCLSIMYACAAFSSWDAFAFAHVFGLSPTRVQFEQQDQIAKSYPDRIFPNDGIGRLQLQTAYVDVLWHSRVCRATVCVHTYHNPTARTMWGKWIKSLRAPRAAVEPSLALVKASLDRSVDFTLRTSSDLNQRPLLSPKAFTWLSCLLIQP
jgi:hypothetical protein